MLSPLFLLAKSSLPESCVEDAVVGTTVGVADATVCDATDPSMFVALAIGAKSGPPVTCDVTTEL